MIAKTFDVDTSEILFVGDEEKDFLTAQNAGCSFMFIDEVLARKNSISTDGVL